MPEENVNQTPQDTSMSSYPQKEVEAGYGQGLGTMYTGVNAAGQTEGGQAASNVNLEQEKAATQWFYTPPE